MAFNVDELDKDLKTFETEEGSVETVADDDLAHWWHESQSDSFGGEDSTNVKRFFDFIARHVFLPWLNAIAKVLNALKSTVERDYLKSERVQQKYDPDSADPMSGKAVAKAVELTDTKTIWEGISMTGCRLEAEGDKFWRISLSTMILRMVSHGGELSGDQTESITEGWAGNVRIFVRNLSTDELYFISAAEASAASLGEYEPVPVLNLATIKKETVDELFPAVEAKEDITAQASWYALPSDDAKIECEIDFEDQTTGRYIYLCTPDLTSEQPMYIRDDATSPFLFPDDFDDREMAATYWKAGNYFEAGAATSTYLLSTAEQTDKAALSKTRMLEILLHGATEKKTIYIPVARFNDNFTLTEEMKKNGLVIRRNAPNTDYVGGAFTIYSPSGSIVSEPSITAPEEAGAVLPFDVSGYEVGSQFMFYGWTDYSYGGNLEVQMPVTMEYVSKAKLADLLGQAGSVNISSSYGLITNPEDGVLQIS